MGTVLGTLGQLGYRWAYRILDAQYFGVPQRRRRVFIVAHLGDGADPAEVLFDAASVCGDSPESREATADVARCLTSSPSGSRYDSDTENLIAHSLTASQTAALNCATDPNQTVIAYQCHGSNVGPMGSLRTGGNETGGVPFAIQERAVSESLSSGPGGKGYQEGLAFTIEARTKPQSVATQDAVRRLTPVECERLMGWPDNHTIGSDSARYRMCGNGVVAPVAEWIGRRIVEADQG